MTDAKWSAKWTGRGPSLCSGKWILRKDNELIDDIPFQGEPAQTYGEYERWYFDESYLEVFESYTDGMPEEAWIEHFRPWLKTIADESDFSKIYWAFSVSDWRYSSCGGCI